MPEEIGEEARSAREVVSHLTRASRLVKTYLPNNPIYQKFLSGLKDRFDTHLQRFGEMKLKVRQSEIAIGESSIYENPNRMESLAFRLFVDGIREIAFLPGLPREEIIAFLQIIDRDHDRSSDDDVVTLLWENGLPHIRYTLFEGYEETGTLEAKGPSREQLAAVSQEAQAVQEPPLSRDLASMRVLPLRPEEINRVKREMEEEERLDLVGELLSILFDILRVEEDVYIFKEVIGILDSIFAQLIARGDLGHARAILQFYHEVIGKPLSPSILEEASAALVQAGDPARIKELEAVINMEGSNLEEIGPLLTLFDHSALPSLIDLLGSANRMKVRRALCEALAEGGRRELKPFLDRLGDGRWFLLRNIIFVLTRIPDPDLVEHLSLFPRHPEPRVRREAIHALDSSSDPKASRLLAEFLDDSDPMNRVVAVRSIAKKGDRLVLPRLLSHVESKVFQEADPAGKREIFETLGRLGGDEIVDSLKKFLGRKGWRWFSSPADEERGLCAVAALQRIGTQAAVEALRYGTESSGRAIRDASQKALDALARRAASLRKQ